MPRVKLTAEQRAERYHAEHPDVYTAFVRYARQFRGIGRRWASADGILHLIRAEYWIQRGDSEFMINNDCSAYYARMLIAEDPSFNGFFELRQTKGERRRAAPKTLFGDPPPVTKAVVPRTRDPLFDAIATASGLDPATSGGLIAKVRKTLANAVPAYTADDVHQFARDFWTHCPYASRDGRARPTPNEIEKYIGLLRAEPPPVQRPPANSSPTKGEAADNYAARLLHGINEREAERVDFSGKSAIRE